MEATGKLFRDTKSREPKDQQGAQKTVRSAPLLSLELLVSSLSIFDVTMPHDTIYALLAIARDTTPFASEAELLQGGTTATDGGAPAQKIDRSGTQMMKARTTSALEDFTRRKRYTVAYESPYVDACKTFIHFCLTQSEPTRALDIICRPWASEGNKVDAQQNFFYENRPVPTKADMRLPSWVPQLSGAPYAMYAHPGVHTLKMGRKNADPLVGLPDTHQRNYSAAETKGIDIKDLRFRKRITHNMQHFSLYVKGFILDTIDRVYPASQGGAVPEEWVKAVEWNDVEKFDPPDEFWRTLVGDRGLHGRNPPVYYARACKESFLKGGLQSGSVSTSDLINNERCSVVAQFCRRVQAVIWNRSLIKTSEHTIGLAIKHVQKGDFACILYGCTVPVILRRCVQKKTLQQLKEEREEDFLNTLVDAQRNWKARLARREKWKKAPSPVLPVKSNPSPEAAETILSNDSKDADSGPGTSVENITLPDHDNEKKPEPSEKTVKEAWDEKYEAWLIENPTRDDDSRYWHYEFLGEAYVHGMMDGEAIGYQNENPDKIITQRFELR